jgi:hypothetical protein
MQVERECDVGFVGGAGDGDRSHRSF